MKAIFFHHAQNRDNFGTNNCLFKVYNFQFKLNLINCIFRSLLRFDFVLAKKKIGLAHRPIVPNTIRAVQKHMADFIKHVSNAQMERIMIYKLKAVGHVMKLNAKS